MRIQLALLGLVVACAGARPVTPPVPVAPAGEVETTLFLIGDAGAPAIGGEPVLQALADVLGNAGGERVVVFLGDNVYRRGMPDSTAPDRREAERRLNAQMDVVTTARARGIFVPGNHDWSAQGPDGWNAIRRQTQYLRQRGGPDIALVPGDGCPGPTVVDVGRRVRVLALDTEWWVHDYVRPEGPGSGCRAGSPEAVADSFRADILGAGGRVVVVASHHPLASGGEHGGYFGIEDHIFPLRKLKRWLWIPLPIIGSFYPLARQHSITNQDVSGRKYRGMIQAFEAAMKDHRPLVWAGGHDHGLQVMKGDTTTADWLLVSGAGIFGHEEPVHWRRDTRFAASEAGFMRLEFLTDGRVRLGVLGVDRNGEHHERFSTWVE